MYLYSHKHSKAVPKKASCLRIYLPDLKNSENLLSSTLIHEYLQLLICTSQIQGKTEWQIKIPRYATHLASQHKRKMTLS